MPDQVAKNSLLKKYRVYIVSSICIVITMLFVLYVKKFWPFGDASFMSGDFVMQGWAYATGLRHKLMTGDSLFYTFESGYGINYYSNLAFYFNPFMLLFSLVPTTSVLQTATITYILTLLLCNISMLIYLTNRPKRALERENFGNMLFSLSFTLCMYVVSNTVNWNFLFTAVFFPLILLGLEHFVYHGKWKLYTCSLAVAFLTCYYFTGLFCVFIVLYYLVLEFDSFQLFVDRSLRLIGLSAIAVGISAFLSIPTYLQLMSQSYSVSGYDGGLWFVDYFDTIQNFFAFNNSIEIGSAENAYGEISLYFGLLPLLFATMYFFNARISIKERIRKLTVFILYMLSFDLNPLNYVMHLFHYPSWFPNRFSWFFIMYCVILAYENWIVMRNNKYKRILIPAICSGMIWIVLIILCSFEAPTHLNSYTYQYSALIIAVYLLVFLLHSISRKVAPAVLVILGCLELVLSFSYSIIFRSTVVSMSRYNNGYVEMRDLINQYCRDEAHGYSKILTQRDYYGQQNTGLFMQYKSPTAFASSINDTGGFLVTLGIYCGTNNYKHFTYVPATMSMFNNQYIYINKQIVDYNSYFYINSIKDDIYDNYPVLYDNGIITIRENPDVLSVGYLIDQGLEEYEDEDVFANLNNYVEHACGVNGIMQETALKPVEMVTLNCQSALIGNDLVIGHNLADDSFSNVDFTDPLNIFNFDVREYDPSTDSYVLITYEAQEPGDYYIEMEGELCRLGNLEKGEQGQVIMHVDATELVGYIAPFTVKSAVFNYDKWEQAYNALARNQLEVQEMNSSYVKGTLDADRAGLLFMSIAYDSNWHAYVDGQEVPIEPVDSNAFLSIPVEEGTHSIEIIYKQRGIVIGTIVSGFSVLGLAVLWIQSKKRGNHKDAE